MRVKAAAARLYWTHELGTIKRANLDGSNPQVIISETVGNGVVVDGNNLYWTDLGGTINRANLDGTNPRPSLPTRKAHGD